MRLLYGFPNGLECKAARFFRLMCAKFVEVFGDEKEPVPVVRPHLGVLNLYLSVVIRVAVFFYRVPLEGCHVLGYLFQFGG